MELHAQERYRVNAPGTVGELIGDEVVVINLETGHYYSLPAVAAEIWSRIEATGTAADIVEHLAAAYAAGGSDIANHVTTFLASLELEGLVTRSVEPGPQLDQPAPAAAQTERRPFEPPRLEKFTDMEEFLLVDPIHEVDVTSWPVPRPRS